MGENTKTEGEYQSPDITGTLVKGGRDSWEQKGVAPGRIIL